MLDARIYRMGLVVAALALVVLAFSLANQAPPRNPSLAPQAFNGENVAAEMQALARSAPSRRAGSFGDESLASTVAAKLKSYGFSVDTTTFSGRTAQGTRTLENVVATRPGTESGSIVVVAHRDARGSPSQDGLSGTATLVELARDLQGETLNRTVVLASVSGSGGTVGATELARTLPGPIDAVIALGDLASAHIRQPIVVPWSTAARVAPPVLRNTLASALEAQAGLHVGFTNIGGQFAHLAFPFTVAEQAPFGARGVPAVELSLSGEQDHPPSDAAFPSSDQLTGVGRAVLSTISALDGSGSVAAPSAYVLLAGKVVPGWAISLFVLTLFVPVALTSIDALARARRRGHAIARSVLLVLLAAVPFALAAAVVLAARVLGIVSAPPGPLAPADLVVDGTAVAVMAVAALVALAAAALLRLAVRAWMAPSPARASTRSPDSRVRSLTRTGDGVAVALLVVLWLVALAIWVRNPYAAALLVPALHLWLWAIDRDARLPLPVRVGMVLLGALPVVALVAYYARLFGYSPPQLAWSAALLIAGRGVSLPALLEWSIVLGCLTSAAAVIAAAARRPALQPTPVTVRGPVTYAGPGSLGGTKSAMRR